MIYCDIKVVADHLGETTIAKGAQTVLSSSGFARWPNPGLDSKNRPYAIDHAMNGANCFGVECNCDLQPEPGHWIPAKNRLQRVTDPPRAPSKSQVRFRIDYFT
jgi:hypothetical protein